jgi:hypothetical protein
MHFRVTIYLFAHRSEETVAVSSLLPNLQTSLAEYILEFSLLHNMFKKNKRTKIKKQMKQINKHERNHLLRRITT